MPAVRLSVNSVEFCWKYRMLLEMDRQPPVRKLDLAVRRYFILGRDNEIRRLPISMLLGGTGR
jgi:hypothetical protein